VANQACSASTSSPFSALLLHLPSVPCGSVSLRCNPVLMPSMFVVRSSVPSTTRGAHPNNRLQLTPGSGIEKPGLSLCRSLKPGAAEPDRYVGKQRYQAEVRSF